MKKQKIYKRDILRFKEYLYRDKANANTYQLFDQYDSFIIRYDRNLSQFKYVHFDCLPKNSSYYTRGEVLDYLEEFTTFKDEYRQRQNSLNPRYDESLRIQIHTEYVDRKRYRQLEQYFNNEGK